MGVRGCLEDIVEMTNKGGGKKEVYNHKMVYIYCFVFLLIIICPNFFFPFLVVYSYTLWSKLNQLSFSLGFCFCNQHNLEIVIISLTMWFGKYFKCRWGKRRMKGTCGERRSQVTEGKFLLGFGVISYFQLLIFSPFTLWDIFTSL